MKKISLVFLILLTLLFSLNVNAATFELSFDDIYDDSLVEPFVGGGVFSFDGDIPTDGSYNLLSLTGFSFFFAFDSDILSVFQADQGDWTNFITDPSSVFVNFSNNGQQVNFDTFTGFPLPSTPYGGALEIIDPSTGMILSFEPGIVVGGQTPIHYSLIDDSAGGNIIYKGNYGSSPVPVPAALWLFGSGLAGLALLRRKRS